MQELKRLGEEEAALVIRRALEIQGEPGTVTLEELRLAATELRIDPAALEKALAERLAEQPLAVPAFEPREVVSLYRTELERSWKGGASQAHIEALLTALGGPRNMWTTPIGQRPVWTTKCPLGPGYGTVSVVQVDGVTTISSKVHIWPSLVAGVVSYPLWLALFAKIFMSPYGDPGREPALFVFGAFAAVMTTLFTRGFAIRAARNKLDAIEAALKGANK